MIPLKTLSYSTYPIDCHILKGRLETEGLTCFIYDENVVWVHPFISFAVGRVKLKIPKDQIAQGRKILNELQKGIMSDEHGEYYIREMLDSETERQNKLLELKSKIRSNPSLLDSIELLKVDWLTPIEFEELVTFEKKFQKWTNTEFKFTWQQFWYELFDFNRNVFLYLRPRPVEYYLEKDLVDNYMNKTKPLKVYICPNCHSGNVSYGYAFNDKWDIPYLILSFLFFIPFPPIRKNCHCFDCGHNFKRKKSHN